MLIKKEFEINEIKDLIKLYNETRLMPAENELIDFIVSKNKNINKEAAKIIWSKAYEDGHSSGEHYQCLDEELDYINDILEALKKGKKENE